MMFGYKIYRTTAIKAMEKKAEEKGKKKVIRALTEGQHLDVLTSGITGYSTGSTYIDKNNYPTYVKQIQAINQMYNNETDYGSEILRSIIETRVSFIGGSGLSVISKGKTLKFITKFLNDNKLLEGSELLNNIKVGEMEGKDLLLLTADNSNQKIKVNNFSYYITPYNIETDPKDRRKVTGVDLSKGDKKSSALKIDKVSIDKVVYVKLGGSPDRVNDTPPKTSNILTDIENMSRAKYDMRKNNHLFGKVTPYFKTQTGLEARAINNSINAGDFQIGKSYAGTANFSLVEPSGKGQEVLAAEILLLARIISMNTGIPIHWLSWPDVLSNRGM